MVWPLARLPTVGPLVPPSSPGTRQLKAGSAVPGADSRLDAVHSGVGLHTPLPRLVVSQTKRMRLPAGGTVLSVMRTLVPSLGPLLVTRTR